MRRSNFKERLRDRAENLEGKGLVWILILMIMGLLAAAVLYFNQVSDYQALAPETANNSQSALARAPRSYSVFYNRGVFSPTNLRIHQGDTVVFTNNSYAPLWINSDAVDGPDSPYIFNSQKNILPQGTFSHIFQVSGIFPYHNENNPNEIGTIIVR